VGVGLGGAERRSLWGGEGREGMVVVEGEVGSRWSLLPVGAEVAGAFL